MWMEMVPLGLGDWEARVVGRKHHRGGLGGGSALGMGRGRGQSEAGEG